MKKITQLLLFFAILWSLGTFANGLVGVSPTNPETLNTADHVFGPSVANDFVPYSNSSVLEGLPLGVTTTMSKAEAPCNEYSPLISSVYSNLSVKSDTGILGGDKFSNKGRVIDNNLNNTSSYTTILGGSAWIEVKDNTATGGNVYPAGSYAGFIINDVDLVSIGGSLKVETYLGSTKQETYTDANLISTILGSGKRRLGFATTKNFDRVRFVVNAGLTVVTTVSVYYAEIVKPCPPLELECNQPTPLVQADNVNNKPGHAVIVEPSRTGLSGINIGTLTNTSHVIETNTDSFATMSINVGILGSASISIRDLDETFPAGHFAGFNISNSNFLELDILGQSEVRTYLNGTFQESSSVNSSLIEVSLFGDNGRHTIGFVTTMPFDEIRYTMNQPVGVSLGATNIYHGVARKYCPGPELECNTQTTITSPEYPIDLNMARTGIEGVCALCTLSNPEYVLNGDENSGASIFLPVAALSSAGISVRNGYEAYPSNTYVAFDVSNPSLLNVELLGNITIELYKDNILVQTSSGTGQLVASNTSIIGGVEHGLIGTVSNVEFDEARFVIQNIVGVDLGITKVYNMVITKGCPGEFDCQTTTALTTPDYSVVVENARTGIESGVACVLCEIDDPENIISDNENEAARIDLAVGAVGSSGSISVRDLSLVYPEGTMAGFVVRDINPILQVGLLNGIRISTYLDGVLQESKLGEGQIIDLNVLLPLLGSGTERRAVGFVTTKPFNELRITYTTLLEVLNYLDVYYSFADGRFANGGGFDCNDYIKLIARNDINQTPENSTVNGNTLTNDQGASLAVKEATYLDINGDSQNLLLSTPTNIYDINGNEAGVVTLNLNGSYSFIPENGFTGSVPIAYTVEDENGFTDLSDLTIKVIPLPHPFEDNPPTAINDNIITENVIVVTGNILNNDSGESLTVQEASYIDVNGVAQPFPIGAATVIYDDNGSKAGVLTLNPNGTYSFTPEAGFTGSVPINYTATDVNGLMDKAVLTIKVVDNAEEVNTTYANDDSNIKLQGESMNGNILTNDFDPQGDNQILISASANIGGSNYPLTLGAPTSIPGVGLVNLNADGTYSFAPEGDFIGTLVVTYSIKDENNPTGLDATSSATLYLTSLGSATPDSCIEIFPGGEWNQSINKAEAGQLNPPVLTYDPLTVAGTNAGMFFDVYRLDNSFNLTINGTPIVNQEIQFDSGTSSAPSNNIRFLDGDLYRYDAPAIWQIVGTPEKPMIRVEVSPEGEVTLYGSKTSGGQLHELVLHNGAVLNPVVWNQTTDNQIGLSQDANGWTSLHGKVYGESICSTGLYEITKTGSFDDSTPAEVGDMITYTIIVENVANEDISDVMVMDPLLGGELSGYVESGTNDAILNIGETWTYTVQYPITSEDIANEGVYNQATVFGKDSNGNAIPTKKSNDPIGDPGPDPERTNFTYTPLSGAVNCEVRYAIESEDPFYWIVMGTGGDYTNEGTVSGTNGGFVFDIYRLDNSFNMSINGTAIAAQEIQFQSQATSGINVGFKDGDQYEVDTPEIWRLRGDEDNPMLRVKVALDGSVQLFGSKVTNGALYELELTNGNSFNSDITWNSGQDNSIVISQRKLIKTVMDGSGYGVEVTCDPYTLEKVGVFNDESGDGISQAGETITYTFTLENTGNIAVHEPVVYDALFGGAITTNPTGDTNSNDILDIDETWVYQANYVVTEENIARKGVYNQAEARGNDNQGSFLTPVLSKDPDNTSPDAERPDHTFVLLVGEECINQINVANIEYKAYGNPNNGQSTTNNATLRASNAGYILDIYKLDNSFNMNINGTDITSEEIEFQSRFTSGINIQFIDGDKYEVDTPPIYRIIGDEANPMLRLVINKDGEVSLFGSKTSQGPLFELEMTNGVPFNTVPWNNNADNTITISQKLNYTTVLKAAGYVVINQCASDYVPFRPYGDQNGSENDDALHKVNYYPNPVNTTLYVEANTIIEGIEVYNLLGQMVINQSPNSKETKIDMDFLQANVYMMKVTLNGKTETYRVVKQ